ncbi:MAG: Gldg family protein [Mariprofundaceae bacterium]|nr:Gldg family protein [Mariprofundaceae bacterium]
MRIDKKEAAGSDQRNMMRRSARIRVLCVVLLCALLFMGTNLSHVRSDWTEDQLYSLSDSTRQLLDTLEEPLMIRAYITSDMPQPYGQLQRFIEDMLQAYYEAGHGYVGFDVIDPSTDQNILTSLKALNVPKVQVQVIENDRAQVKQGYLAIVLEYLDRKETLAVVQSEEGFEYLLSKKIKKITGNGRVKIGITSSFGTHTIEELQKFVAWMQDDYEFVKVDLTKAMPDADIKVLIVAGMTAPPSENWRFHLDQFRMRGGGVWVLAGNARPLLSQGFDVQAVDAYANDWLRDDLKVVVEPGLVMDKRAQRVVVRNGMFRSQVDYPFVPSVLDLHEVHVISRDLSAVSVPFPSPLQPLTDHAEILMRSSPWTAVQNGPPFDVYPLLPIEKRFAGLQMQSVVLALLFEGYMSSAFQQAEQATDGHFLSETHTGRLLIVASLGLLDDEFMDGSALVLALNSLDWLSHDEALIALRSRGMTDRPLVALSNAGKQTFKILWLFALPLLILLFALWRWWKLKHPLIHA